MTLWRAVAAVAGFLLALWIAPHLQRRAAPDELPGAMQAAGLDPSGPILQFGFIVGMTFLATCVVPRRGLVREHRRGRGRRAEDVVLLATLFPLYFAFLDVFTANPRWLLVAAAAAIAAIRVFVPSRAFSAAPLAILLQLGFVAPRTAALLSVAWIIVTPWLLRGFDTRRLIPWMYAIFVLAYPLALLGIGTPPYLDFFEDGHELVVAGELAHGERPYADIVPVHGLIADGAADWLIDRGSSSAAEILRVRRVVSALNVVAIYAVVLAATGSAPLGLLAVFLAISMVPAATLWIRTIPALFALAATCAAIRLRSRRWLAAAGVLVVVAFLFGMEFGVYSAIVAGIAALRMRTLRPLILGMAAAAAAVAIAFSVGRFATAFVRTSLFELLPAGRVYVPGPLQWPADRLQFAAWVVALVFAAAATFRGSKRVDGVWAMALWAVVAGLSYAQRRHAYASFVLPALVVALVWLVARRQQIVAAVLAIVVVVAAQPLKHVYGVATPLRASGGAQPGGSPVLQGVVVPANVARGIEAARRFTSQSLPAGTTWFDFSNSASLYFLLDRRCPTRHHQVPFYESAEGQQAVIAALERDRSVRAALIAFPGGENAIDGVPNRVRAPLVWQYVQTHFEPAYDADGVVFWLRR